LPQKEQRISGVLMSFVGMNSLLEC
jgi:hypothetical protein